MKKIMRFITHNYKKVQRTIKFTFKIRSYISQKKSYYPELKHKRNIVVYFEQVKHILKHGEINMFYYLYGLDVKGRDFDRDGFYAYNEFKSLRNKRNFKKIWNCYVCLLRDKTLFTVIANNWKFPCFQIIGNFKNGNTVLFRNGEEANVFSVLQEYKDLFFKPKDSECGEGVFCLGWNDGSLTMNDKETTKEEVENYLNTLKTEIIIQNRIIQHNDMRRLYSSSINTLRIVTVKNYHTGSFEHFHSILRIGANGNVIDNWAKGGIAVGVEPSGRLYEYGFFKPEYGLKVDKHPNSGVKFNDFVVPFYQDAVDMCLKFHETLQHVAAIGWDVAITPSGPCVIEGNDNFAISLHQIYGGLKTQFERLLK